MESAVAVDEAEAMDDIEELDSVAEDVEVIVEYIKMYSAVDSTSPGAVTVSMPDVTMPPDRIDPETTVVAGAVHDRSHIQKPYVDPETRLPLAWMLPQPSEQQMAVVTSALEYVCATLWPDGHSGSPAQTLAPLAYGFAADVHPGAKQALSCGYTACSTGR